MDRQEVILGDEEPINDEHPENDQQGYLKLLPPPIRPGSVRIRNFTTHSPSPEFAAITTIVT